MYKFYKGEHITITPYRLKNTLLSLHKPPVPISSNYYFPTHNSKESIHYPDFTHSEIFT